MPRQWVLPLGAGLGVPVSGIDGVSASCGRCVWVWLPEDSQTPCSTHVDSVFAGAGLCMPLGSYGYCIQQAVNCAECGAVGAQRRVSSVFSQQGSCRRRPWTASRQC